MDSRFNLIEEKWILVMQADGRTESVSLCDVFSDAHQYRGLAGETPTQNFAMLRILLAVLYAALFRGPYDDPDEVLEDWLELWEKGKFPTEDIQKYLVKWHDRFWLISRERPFMQVASGKDGITMENAAERAGLEKAGKPTAPGVQRAAKLNGTIFESGNKEKLFNPATGEEKYSLSMAEAARWLIHVIGFDDGGIKPYYPKNTAMNQTNELAKCSVSWLGSISPVYAEGNSLFETLMLNLVLLQNGKELWEEQRPTWEYPESHITEAMGVAMPDNPAEICSFLFRRIMLIPKNDRIQGFIRYVGEAFQRVSADTEQWTMWSIPKAKKNETAFPIPRYTRMPVQLWREMGALLAETDHEKQPGIVRWIGTLGELRNSPLRDCPCRFHYTKALYEIAQQSSMTEIQDDSVVFSTGLLTAAGQPWVAAIGKELQLYNRIAWQIGLLSQQLLASEGGKVHEGSIKLTAEADARSRTAQEQFYYEMDTPFRRWLQTIRAEDDSEVREARIEELRNMAKRTALHCGETLVGQVSPAAFGKRMKGDGENKVTAPEAWIYFKRSLNRILRELENQS